MPTLPPRMRLGGLGLDPHSAPTPLAGAQGVGAGARSGCITGTRGIGRYSRGAPVALGVQAGPVGTEVKSQEPKQEGLARPSPALLLCQLLKLTPPWTQPQCPLVAKYSIAQFLHPCIPSTATGLVPAWPGPAGSRRGRWEPRVAVR